MRVLYVCEYPSLNGGEHSLLAFLQQVGERVEAVVAAPLGPFATELATRKISHVELSARQSSGERLDNEQLQVLLRQRITQTRPDLVHANSISTSRWLGRLADSLEMPTLGHLRDIVGLSANAARELSNNSRLLAVSEATKRHMIGQGVESRRCFVVNNGVDLAEFASTAATSANPFSRWGVADHSKVILTVGQIGMRKGLLDAAQALQPVLDADPTAHWIVVGERHSQKDEAIRYERSIREAVQAGCQRGQVHFAGRRNDVPELLAQATILLHAARQEPLGRVLLEAAASGLPIVATDVGGTREIFPAGEAVLVEAADINGLQNAVESVLGDSAMRRQLGLAARQRMEQAFDIRDRASDLLAHYRQLLS